MVDSKQQWKAWLYLLPAIILLLIFTVWPIVNTLYMAFSVRWDPEAPAAYETVIEKVEIIDENGEKVIKENEVKKVSALGAYVPYRISESKQYDYQFGLASFETVVSNGGFWRIMQNTVLLCVLTVPISTFLALLIAVCLNAIKPLRRLLQTIFFLPYVTNSIAIGMVFYAMFNIVGLPPNGDIAASESIGIINTVIGVFGIDPINWINQGSDYWANMAVMIIYIVWNALPFKILILLGGLQSVNKQYYEAAKIDSTPKWRVFTRITVPLLSPMIAYVVITGFIGGFKEYTSIVGIFGEDMKPPAMLKSEVGLQTMVGYIYESLGDETAGEGIASAAALLLFVLIFAVTLVNLAVSKKKTHY